MLNDYYRSVYNDNAHGSSWFVHIEHGQEEKETFTGSNSCSAGARCMATQEQCAY